MKDICQGCKISSNSTFCSFRLAQKEETCVCTDCLVKIVCIKECDKRVEGRSFLLEGKTMWEFIESHKATYTIKLNYDGGLEKRNIKQ
jgi:hypothetical protein